MLTAIGLRLAVDMETAVAGGCKQIRIKRKFSNVSDWAGGARG